jgi:CDP-glycerol glycerophosphotransferase
VGTAQGPGDPLISIVIPVRGVRPYLPECLDSVLGPQEGTAIEVIAVDDASADGSGALLDQRSRADGRLTVVHLAQAAGPGNARNVGLAQAIGRYVWFVDGDDLVADGAIGAVRPRLEAEEPDVLLVGYREFFPTGRTEPGAGGQLLSSAPPGVFTLADAPNLINLTMTAWSKLFRREFLVRLHEPFRSGIHEDIPVSCAALLAGRLAALDRPCYCYRRSRPGSFMATTSADHFAVFRAYDEVFAMMHKLVADADPVATDAVQSAVFERAIWHYAAVLQTTGFGLGRVGRPGLVPRRDRRQFFERMQAEFVRYVPEHYQLPRGPRGAKLGLIKRGDYLGYELLEPINRVRVGLAKSARAARSSGLRRQLRHRA